ncbi:MAG: alpha/beta hydrolase [Oscillospiraceae bacterium]|jgi:pimeloyl-ACP methyl ester carboxylesterase
MSWILKLLLALILVYIVVLSVLFQRIFVRRGQTEKQAEKLECPKRLIKYQKIFSDAEQFLEHAAYESVSILSFDGLRLWGRFYPAPSAKGTILLMHGYRADGFSNFGCVLAFYHDLGYNLLLVSQRSHWESSGRYICFGVKERFDCRDWAAYLSQRPDCEGKSIILEGISMGATTVLMTAGLELPETVDGIIADCGFTSPWDIVADLAKRRFHLPAHPLLDGLDCMTRWFAGFRLRDCSTLDALQQSHIPVLFIHGEQDNFVPCSMTQANYAACVAEKKLVTVPGAGHGISYLVDQSGCQKALQAFLTAHTR